MKSAMLGKNTSGAEVTNISRRGFWLLLDDEELFVPFKEFPWFKEATVGQILNLQRPQLHHLYWSDLEVDLAEGSIRRPADFPLVPKAPRETRSRNRA